MNRATAFPLLAVFLVAALSIRAADGVVAPTSAAAKPDAPDAAEWATVRKDTMRIVWSTVYESYFDETFGGVNWPEVGRRYRDQLPTATSNDELRALLTAMIGELGRSHFAILPREMAVFTPEERSKRGTAGLDVEWLEGGMVVAAVKPGSAAERAGVRPGMRINSVDETPLAPLMAEMQKMNVADGRAGAYLVNLVNDRLRGAVGATVLLGVRDTAGRELAPVLTCEEHDGPWSDPIGNFPSLPTECETRRDASGIGYLRFNVFAPVIMKQVRTFLRSLRPGDGLIIDLRGNPGGLSLMAAAISGWLFDRELSLGETRLRQGVTRLPVYPQEGAFLGPIAVLIDGRSASTSEILAAGLRDHGRARLFGSRTAGAAMPSVVRALPTGDLFQYAIADIRTPKDASIEGKGVEPDETFSRTVADLVNGRDPAAERARAWLAEMQSRTAGQKTATARP